MVELKESQGKKGSGRGEQGRGWSDGGLAGYVHGYCVDVAAAYAMPDWTDECCMKWVVRTGLRNEGFVGSIILLVLLVVLDKATVQIAE